MALILVPKCCTSAVVYWARRVRSVAVVSLHCEAAAKDGLSRTTTRTCLGLWLPMAATTGSSDVKLNTPLLVSSWFQWASMRTQPVFRSLKLFVAPVTWEICGVSPVETPGRTFGAFEAASATSVGNG